VPVFAGYADAEKRVSEISPGEPPCSYKVVAEVLQARQRPVEITGDLVGGRAINARTDGPRSFCHEDEVVGPRLWGGLKYDSFGKPFGNLAPQSFLRRWAREARVVVTACFYFFFLFF